VDTDDTDVAERVCTEAATCDACLSCSWEGDTCSTVWDACALDDFCPGIAECVRACGRGASSCINNCYAVAAGSESMASAAFACSETECEPVCD
jgi:hypothetical protein